MSPASTRRRVVSRRRVLVGAAVVLVLAAGWLVVRGRAAQRELTAARAELAAMQSSLLAGDTTSADQLMRRVQARTTRARRLTSDPVWAVAARVPVAGRSPRVVRGLAQVADQVTRDALPPLREAAGTLDPKKLRTSGSTIATKPFQQAAPALERATQALDRAQIRVDGLPGWLVAPPVRRAQRSFLSELEETHRSTATARDVAQMLPAMLGADGPRSYFLAIQNNAELRATGGLVGAFGIVEARNGRISLVSVGSNRQLPSLARPAIDIGESFERRYARFQPAREWRNTNVTPDFPTVNAMYAAMYREATSERIDGTIAIDPVALSYILKVTGPARLSSGQVVSAANVVALTERDVYARIPDPDDQDKFFELLARSVYERLTSGSGDTQQLVKALSRAVGEGRLLVASSLAEEQRVLSASPIGGAIPVVAGPYLHVTINNAAGGKLDYYLRRRVDYTLAEEADGQGKAEVTVTLRNTAPKRGLPAYVTQRLDAKGKRIPPGQNRIYVSVFAGIGAGLESATLGGKPVSLESDVERGHAVFSTYLEMKPGATYELALRIVEPRFANTVTLRPFPMAFPDDVHVKVSERSG
jgi:hypothetical protein